MTTSEHITYTHQDLIILSSWMAHQDYTADDVAYAIEKPWKYRFELKQAKDELTGRAS